MRKAIGWIVVIIVLSGIGFRLFQAGQQRAARHRRVQLEKQAAAVPVAVARPRIGAISSSLSFVGTVKGEDQVQVFSEAPGKLLRYTVNEGDRVKKDQLLALVDRAVTGMEFEPARVKSPISGVVGKLFLDRGSDIGLQVPVAMVVKMDKVKVAFNVGEKKLAKVKRGISAEVKVDTYPGEVFVGRLTRMSPVIDPVTRSASCEVTLENRDHRLKPGMFAEVELLVETHTSALLIQTEAIIEDLVENRSYVFVVEGDKAAKKEVEIGITRRDTVEVVSGLEDDQMVIIKGQHYLKGGERVDVVR